MLPSFRFYVIYYLFVLKYLIINTMPPKTPTLSIIIPTWNTAETTKQCIDSLNRFLSSSLNFEIILVDNNSTDNTQQLVSRLSRVVYLKNSANLGFSKACNIGFRHSQGKYLLFLNSDMLLIDNSLIHMLAFLKQHRNIGAIGPKFLNPDLTPQASVFPPQTVPNAIRQFWFNLPSYSKYIPSENIPTGVANISGGAILIKRSNFIKAGKWNENYSFYFEDLDLCRRLQSLDLQLYYYPHCQIIHHHGLSGKNIVDPQNQWRRLIPGSKIYHGPFKHYLISLIIKLGNLPHRFSNHS